MKVCLIGSFVLLCLLSELQVSKAGDYIRKDGYCMWYGQCGTNPSTLKPINCLYNGPAKPIDSPDSRNILSELCPEFARDDSKVCCSHDQLVSLKSGIQSAQEMMAHCPACWKNFRELLCHLMCSPNNSMFITPIQLSADQKSIVSIAYYVNKAFRNGLYSSCRNVAFQNSNKKIMNFLCGTTVDHCSPLKFLRFMGDPALNGVSPFLIEYPDEIPPGITAMNTTIRLCNKAFYEPFTHTTREACVCNDCIESCKGPLPIRANYITAKIIFSLKPSSNLNQRPCYQNFFTENDCILTGTILRLKILQKVLKVQGHLMNMSLEPPTGSKNITLADFCVKSLSNSCIVLSALQYWQNDMKKLNKCISALGGPCSSPDVFVTAAWGDHLARCTYDPYRIDTTLNISCISLYGDPVFPNQVLGGYDNKNFTDSSLLLVSFAIKQNMNEMEIERAKVWQKNFVEYLKYYDDVDLQLAYVPVDLSVLGRPGRVLY